MTPAERRRLAGILGMLGSEFAGERASAALQAEAFRKRHAMTWEEMLALPAVEVVVEAVVAPEPVWTPTPEPPVPEPAPPVDPWVSPFHLPPGANHPIVMRYGVAAILFVAFAWKTYG